MPSVQLYQAPHSYTPPSEKKFGVVHLEIQDGCPWGQCTYCKTWQGQPLQNKSVEEVIENFEISLEALGRAFFYSSDENWLSGSTRIYLAGADVLAYPTDDLKQVVEYVTRRVNEINKVGRDENRLLVEVEKVSGYASTASILDTSTDDLEELARMGLNVLYWGLDSGATSVLHLVKKNYVKGQAMEAAKKLARIESILPSINVMPGLGGIIHSEAHVRDTIEVLTAANPKWVTMLSIDPTPQYEKPVLAIPGNRPLDDYELTQQIVEIALGTHIGLKKKGFDSFHLAAHDKSRTAVSNNPFTFSLHGDSSSDLTNLVSVLSESSFLREDPGFHRIRREFRNTRLKYVRNLTLGILGTAAVMVGIITCAAKTLN